MPRIIRPGRHAPPRTPAGWWHGVARCQAATAAGAGEDGAVHLTDLRQGGRVVAELADVACPGCGATLRRCSPFVVDPRLARPR